MSELIAKLNEILSDEWACVRGLRRAEVLCEAPGQREVIKRIRKECSVNCANVAQVIRSLGGRPTDVPSPRFSLQIPSESLSEYLDMTQAAQQHIITEIEGVLGDPALKSCRSILSQIQQLHRDDSAWLTKAISAEA